MKEQKTKQPDQIERLQLQIKPLLFDGWTACRAFNLSLSGSTSPEFLSIYRDTKAFIERLKQVTSSEARIAVRKQWREETQNQCDQIQIRLSGWGYRVNKDGNQLYINPLCSPCSPIVTCTLLS